MGTRNLTMVIYGGKTRIAQYGQWDGYPESGGKKVLGFLRGMDTDLFKRKLEKCKFIDDEKQKELDAFYESIGCKDGWMNSDQADKFHEAYPLLTRDNGVDILEMIYEADGEEFWINDSTEFAADGLFCEWAYVIDFDKNTFEVYQGFHKRPLAKNQRFKYLEAGMTAEDKYYPVKMIKKYKLTDLPLTGEFLEFFEIRAKKEEEKYEKEEAKKKKAIA